jgi:hypothetical protein
MFDGRLASDSTRRPKLTVTYIEPGEYTHAQAGQLGLELEATPHELGLATCSADTSFGGFDDDAAADLAEAEADGNAECAHDPATSVAYQIGRPPTHASGSPHWYTPGYHYAGVAAPDDPSQDQRRYEGAVATIEVSNVDVIHPPKSSITGIMHATSRILLTTSLKLDAKGPWLEAGWIERSRDGNRPFLFTVKKRRGKEPWFLRHKKYPLAPGKKVRLKVAECDTTGTVGTCAWILWVRSGTPRWERLRYPFTHMHCMAPDYASRCNVEWFFELHTGRNTVPAQQHPDLNATGGALDWNRLRLRYDPNDWRNATFAESYGFRDPGPALNPYRPCFHGTPYNFTVRKTDCP